MNKKNENKLWSNKKKDKSADLDKFIERIKAQQKVLEAIMKELMNQK